MLINGFDVIADGVFRDPQLSGDGFASQAVEQHQHDRALPRLQSNQCLLRQQFFGSRVHPSHAGHREIDDVGFWPAEFGATQVSQKKQHAPGVIRTVPHGMHPTLPTASPHLLTHLGNRVPFGFREDVVVERCGLVVFSQVSHDALVKGLLGVSLQPPFHHDDTLLAGQSKINDGHGSHGILIRPAATPEPEPGVGLHQVRQHMQQRLSAMGQLRLVVRNRDDRLQ